VFARNCCNGFEREVKAIEEKLVGGGYEESQDLLEDFGLAMNY